jgi:uncharacterized membrane protein YphA (DoxX/SURF4 family)
VKRRGGRQSNTQPAGQEPHDTNWNAATGVGLRFSVVYLTLFALCTQISGSLLPNLSFTYRGLGERWPLRDLTVWIAGHVFGLTAGQGSVEADVSGGEPVLFWVQAGWILLVAVLAAAIWSVLDRRRKHDVALHKWFRLFLRFALAAQLFEYGMTKVIPNQFPPPSLTTLVTPVGDLSLSALLWTSIGAAPAYQIFTGCVELLGGVLVLIPRTTLLGAIISLAAAIQVFVLNMTYDIGLKLVSFHLIVMALLLLAPDMPRLADVFLRNRPTGASTEPPLARTRRGSRIALAAQIAVAAYLLGMYAYINVSFWQVAGGGRPRSPLYGIWDVEQLSVDGQVRSPHLNDYDRRWRRLILEAPGSAVFQRTDDSFARYAASVDAGGTTLALTKGGSRSWTAAFVVERPAPDRLRVTGDMDGHRIEMQLRLVDPETWRLLNSTFRLIRPHAVAGEP